MLQALPQPASRDTWFYYSEYFNNASQVHRGLKSKVHRQEKNLRVSPARLGRPRDGDDAMPPPLSQVEVFILIEADSGRGIIQNKESGATQKRKSPAVASGARERRQMPSPP